MRPTNKISDCNRDLLSLENVLVVQGPFPVSSAVSPHPNHTRVPPKARKVGCTLIVEPTYLMYPWKSFFGWSSVSCAATFLWLLCSPFPLVPLYFQDELVPN